MHFDMVFQFLFIIFLLVTVALAAALALQVRRSRRRGMAYKQALESAQRRVDLQTSRLNMLCRVIPNLPSIILGNEESWQSTVLDDAGALIWADGASYWSYSERERALEMKAARGLEGQVKFQPVRIDIDDGPLSQVAKSRLVLTRVESDIVSEPTSVLAVPLVVGGELLGVYRFVRKGGEPLNGRDGDLANMFLRHLSLALENKSMVANREKFYLELVQTLADILDSRDASSQGQTKRARRLARAIGQELEMPEEFIYYLEFAALMHDIGKIAIDEALLRKPGKLTEQEMEIVKKHPELGYKILAPVSMLAPVAPMVLYHQEWFNGKGYPEGLSGEEIPLGARIVAILDAWCAMTSARPWRPAMSKEEAIKEIVKGAGSQFDPRVVEAFLAVLDRQSVAVEAA
jgi:HD-GYP domain-containing protein (c-di-GMP phosphodiesterase class II)